MLRLRLTAVPVALLLVAGTATAQTAARQRAEALVQAALHSARAGDTALAIKQLADARKADARFATAHYEYGRILSEHSTLGFRDLLKRRDAGNALLDASNLEPDNPWPILELGRLRLKMPGMRIAAQNLFRDALDLAVKKGDSEAAAEVAFEIGQIYDRRYRTTANRYMMIGDARILDPIAAQFEPEYVEQFLRNSAIPLDESGELDAANAEVWYRQALTHRVGHENAAIALSALLYELKRYSEVYAVASKAAAASPASARLKLAEGLGLLRLKRVTQASEVLESAVKLMSDRERSMVASLAPIIRPGDARSYETLDASTRAAYDRAYWDLNDPLFLTNVNEHRLAFLGRVAYSDLMFSTFDLKVRGALTDRGQIILRYGEPPVIATFPPDVQNKNEGETLGRVTTLWYFPEPKMKFVFVGPPAMSTATFAGEFYGYADDLRHSMPVRYDSLPNGLVTEEMNVRVASFRGNQPQNTRVEFHALVPTRKLAERSGTTAVSVETGFMILDGNRNRILDERDTVRVVSTEARDRVRSFHRQFMPGEYGYRVEALEPASMAAAAAKGALSLASYPLGEFAVSDILIGTGFVDEDLRRREDLTMQIIPDNALESGQSLGLYWESYGARPSDEGSVRFRIDISMTILDIERPPAMHLQLLGSIADRLNLSEQGDKKVTVSFDRTLPAPPASDDRVLHGINIQLQTIPAGQYLLEITMTDRESGKVARSNQAVRVRRPQ